MSLQHSSITPSCDIPVLYQHIWRSLGLLSGSKQSIGNVQYEGGDSSTKGFGQSCLEMWSVGHGGTGYREGEAEQGPGDGPAFRSPPRAPLPPRGGKLMPAVMCLLAPNCMPLPTDCAALCLKLHGLHGSVGLACLTVVLTGQCGVRGVSGCVWLPHNMPPLVASMYSAGRAVM